MQGSITLNELGIFIIFIIIAVAGGYAIVTLRNVNGFIKEATGMLQRNQNHVNQIIPNIHEISVNTVSISQELETSLKEAGSAFKVISHETKDRVMTIAETADTLAHYALLIGEIVKTIISMFSSSEKDMK